MVEQLARPDANIEDKLTAFIKAYVENWDNLFYDGSTPFYMEMAVTRTANIPHLGEVLREFTDRLCDTYANGTDAQREVIDKCTASAIETDIYRARYDAVKYVNSLTAALPEVYDDHFVNQMKDAFDNCIVSQYLSKYLTAQNYTVGYSVLLGTNGYYPSYIWKTDEQTGNLTRDYANVFTDDGKIVIYRLYPTDDPYNYTIEPTNITDSWPSTLADTYEQLAFDRAVGWSRWLRLNRQWPSMFFPSGLSDEFQ